MFDKKGLKRTTSALMATSLLALSIPAFSASTTTMQTTQTQGAACATCPASETPTSGSGMIMERQTTYSTTQSTMIPAGTALHVRPRSAVEPAPSLGSNISGELTQPVMVNGVTVIPTGSQVSGEITAVNSDSVNVQFTNVSTPTGESIPIRGNARIARLQGQVQSVQGQPTYQQGNVGMYAPYVAFGRHKATGAERILGGTVGGAVFGGATGALSGLVMPAVYRDDISYGEGTGTLRGLAWGAVMGAGLGLVTGLVSAAAAHDDTAVTTTTSSTSVPTNTATNITTGSVQETPVAYNTTTQAGMQPSDITVILLDPVVIGQ